MRFKQWGMQKSGTPSRCGEDCSFVAEQGPAELDGRQCRWQGLLWHRPYLCRHRYPNWHCNVRLWSITLIFMMIVFKYTMLFKMLINKSLQSCSRSSVFSVCEEGLGCRNDLHDLHDLMICTGGCCQGPNSMWKARTTAEHCSNSLPLY